MEKKNKKIMWTETMTEIVIATMFSIVYIGAALYSAERMGDYNSFKELFFWTFMVLFIVMEWGTKIVSRSPIVYLIDKLKEKGKKE